MEMLEFSDTKVPYCHADFNHHFFQSLFLTDDIIMFQ